MPFEDGTIPVLHPDDLAVLEAYFDRSQDWVDIESMLGARSLDVDDVLAWLGDLLPGDDRLERLRRLAAEVAARPPGERPFPRLPG